jgi:short subunit fatty acids transporter
MIALGVLGVYGMWTRRPGLLYLVVVLSFCPVGFYFLLTPGIFRAIGILNLLALLAAILLHRRVHAAMQGGQNGRSYSARSPNMRGE